MKKSPNDLYQVIQRVTDESYSLDNHNELLQAGGISSGLYSKDKNERDRRNIIVYLNSSPKANQIFWTYRKFRFTVTPLSYYKEMVELVTNMTRQPKQKQYA